MKRSLSLYFRVFNRGIEFVSADVEQESVGFRWWWAGGFGCLCGFAYNLPSRALSWNFNLLSRFFSLFCEKSFNSLAIH